MREISLNVMDIAQNSIVAGASLIEISVVEDTAVFTLTIIIKDNGRGIDTKTAQSVQSPFYTTRTTRNIGMGIPLYKMACEMTGGSFALESQVGVGTELTAKFITSHIDMAPLGAISETAHLLITCNPGIDFIYHRCVDEKSYTLDTREMREILGDNVSLGEPEISMWLMEYLAEQDAALA